MKTKIRMRALSVLLAVLLVSVVMVPAVSAREVNWEFPELEVNNSLDPIVIQNEISPMKGESLHQIPVGSIIHHSSDGITRVFTQDGKQIISAIDADAEKVPVPSAGLLPATHVHQVPNGSDIYTNENITKVYNDEACILTVVDNQRDAEKKLPVPSYGGWIESSYDWSVNEIAQFIAYWETPSSPSSQSDSVIFLFNAVEPSNAHGIVQPVLEWNRHAYRDWTGAAWYVPYQQQGYFSEPIDVDVGDTIKGTLGWNSGISKWNIIFNDLDAGTSTMSFSDCVGCQDVAVFTALEGYNVDADSEVPGDTTFYDMRFKDLNLQTVDITWEPYIDDDAPLTGLNVERPSDNWVKLHTAN
ncbi:hypothetical protein [Methanogenium organophilum]|uniref:Uncharacterized protein n=1 Tax=Methanogenium organophilum TaxID=2199 RepID=A0A9X9S4Q9_METOG|nr:hypothetical protein [Methanogenium organophilum]WAI01440.1 hypothetical protein OU421_00790 [Methanogenium organophilum]